MKDTRTKSISECLVNILISLPIAFLANMIILPLYANTMYNADDFTTQAIVYGQLAIIFTGISLIRQYLMRRFFNRYGPRATAYSIFRKMIKKNLTSHF